MPDSPRILKAESLRGLGAKVAFNYDDLRQRCDAYVERVRQQARQILEDARRDAESIRRDAFDEARDEGRRAGLADAEREIERRAAENAECLAAERIQNTLPALREAAESLSRERQACLAAWEESAVRLSVAIAAKLLRRELATNPAGAQPMIAAALELAAGSRGIRMRLNPDDLALLGDRADDARQALSAGREGAAVPDAELVPDAEIARGGCVVETPHGTIDARLESLLDRIVEELLGTGDR